VTTHASRPAPPRSPSPAANAGPAIDVALNATGTNASTTGTQATGGPGGQGGVGGNAGMNGNPGMNGNAGTGAHAATEASAGTVTSSGTNAGPLRRVPVQGRSVARVARMLDACAELVDEIGYEALTTTILAERAGVAIGSIYQFFPDKRAVVQALTLRSLEAYLERLSGRLSASTFPHWWDGVDAGIDEYIDMHRAVPGFRTLHFGNVVDVHLLDDERDNNAVIANALVGQLVADLDMRGGPNVEFAVMIAVEVADALIQMAFRRDANGDPRVLAEAKALIRDYLQRQA
jgi:AcrR family transcriptional regulator